MGQLPAKLTWSSDTGALKVAALKGTSTTSSSLTFCESAISPKDQKHCMLKLFGQNAPDHQCLEFHVSLLQAHVFECE